MIKYAVDLRRIIVIVGAILIAYIGFASMTSAASEIMYEDKADALKELGLFQGTANGYELDRAPTRAEGAVMLVRLLGKEDDALAKKQKHPFTDVPAWASDYIGYVYSNGITNGLSDSKFGSNDPLSAAQYATFILRALGFSDKEGDFTWNTALDTMLAKNVISSNEYAQLSNRTFLRDHTVLLSYQALLTKMKSGVTLLDYLAQQNVITKQQIDASLIHGPVKLELSTVEGFRLLATDSTFVMATLHTEYLSDNLKNVKGFNMIKFNSKEEADQFKQLLDSDIDSNLHNNQVLTDLLNRTSIVKQGDTISQQLYTAPKNSHNLYEDPPFDTYIIIVFVNENKKMVAYAEKFIEFNDITSVSNFVKATIDLTSLPKIDSSLFRIENHIVEQWPGDQIYRAYRHYFDKDSYEANRHQYGDFAYVVQIRSEQLLADTDIKALTPEKIEELSGEYSSFNTGSEYHQNISGFTAPYNYFYFIYFDFNLNPIAYSVHELPKKQLNPAS